MLIELDLTVHRPAGEVFDALADLRHLPRWDARVTAVELLTGEPVDQDSRFAMVRDGTPYDATLRRHQRPHVLEVTTTGEPMTTRSVVAFMDGAAGTVVILRHERHLRGPRRLVEPFVRRSVRRDLAERLAAFGRYCES